MGRASQLAMFLDTDLIFIPLWDRIQRSQGQINYQSLLLEFFVVYFFFKCTRTEYKLMSLFSKTNINPPLYPLLG